MSKVIKILIFFIVVLLVLNKQIISHVLLYGFSKWIDREIVVDKFRINYKQNLIIINGAKIKNSNEFYYDNIVESEEIILNYNFKSLFSNLIIINSLIIENPIFFFEFLEKPTTEFSPYKIQEMYDDNVGGVNKIIKSKPYKIWPTKDKDINFLILKVKINGAKVLIKTFFSPTPTNINLSNIFSTRIGNGGERGDYTHHKTFLKNLLIDTIAKIPDLKLKNFLDKIYNYENLYRQ